LKKIRLHWKEFAIDCDSKTVSLMKSWCEYTAFAGVLFSRKKGEDLKAEQNDLPNDKK
jgi:hypothetical protein